MADKKKPTKSIVKQEQTGKGLIDVIDSNSKELITMANEYIQMKRDELKHEIKFSLRMSLFAVIIVFVIVGAATWVTILGKIDGSTYTFLLGLIVGYILTFIKSAINPGD